MTTVEATVTSKGQVTIPKEIRDRLGLEAGQKVKFEIEDGELTVRPKRAPMARLQAVREDIRERHEDIDVDAIRRAAIREWASVPDAADRQ